MVSFCDLPSDPYFVVGLHGIKKQIANIGDELLKRTTEQRDRLHNNVENPLDPQKAVKNIQVKLCELGRPT